jgi:uncharacterized protein
MNDPHQTSVVLTVRVKPRAKRAALLGWRGTALKVAVRAAPERGHANDELIALLARALGLPTDALQIVGGTSSPDKRLRVSGLDAIELQQRIDAVLRGAVE